MSNQEEQVEYVDMVGVSVVNTAHDGYRRAGFVLARGENILPPVSAQQWHALEADPRLSVTVIAADSTGNASGSLVNHPLSNPVTLPTEGTSGPTHNHPSPPVATGANGGSSETVPYAPTREELLLGAVMCAELETDPTVFYTKAGTPRIEKWRALVDASLTVDEITQALAGGPQP